MLLFIQNHRNTVILAILQCNNLKPTIQFFFLSGYRNILPGKVASSNTVAKVTITKCQQKRWHLALNNLLVWSQIQSSVFQLLYFYGCFIVHSSFSRFYSNSDKSFFFTKITFLCYWFIKISHWQNYLKTSIVLLKWVHFDNILIIFTNHYGREVNVTLYRVWCHYIICILCNVLSNHWDSAQK